MQPKKIKTKRHVYKPDSQRTYKFQFWYRCGRLPARLIYWLLVANTVHYSNYYRNMIHQVGDGLKHDLQGARMVVRDFTYDDAIGGYYRALCVASALAMCVGTSLSIVARLVAELIGG